MKKIFISYSDKDKNKMRSLQRLISKSNQLTPIIIADNRQALTQLTNKVSEGIVQCDYFIPILTKNSMTNQWVNQEIGFATALGNKIIIPIIDKGIINKLKGFIHKQLDLSYSFISNSKNPHSESALFTRTAKVLINDILIENKANPIDVTIESMFPGKWNSKFILNGRQATEKDIEVKNGNKYFTQGVYWFDIDDVYINLSNGELKFKKNGLKNDPRQIFNDLKIIKIGKHYQGTELDKDNNRIEISYFRSE